jgi:mono/diheme cytochrome c family protein
MRHWRCGALCVVLAGLAGLGLLVFSWIESARLTSSLHAKTINESMAANGPGLLAVHCQGCHANGRSKVDFDGPFEPMAMRRDRPTWTKVLHQLRSQTMPPAGLLQLSAEDREFMIHWVEEALGKETLDLAQGEGVAVRRLSRTEYLNTIRDLFGVRFQPGADFPADDDFWDRCRDMPKLPADLMANYRSAASQILQSVAAQPSVAMPAAGNDEDDVDRQGATQEGADLRLEDQDSDPETRAAFARQMLAAIALRAYRRPPSVDEVDQLAAEFRAAASAGADFDGAIKAALQALLTSPQFLFHIETRAPEGDSADAALRRNFALASRLSYFLWKSMPDEELLAQAEQGVLATNLADQARRMLQDPRARAFARDFATAWLGLAKLTENPKVDAALLRSMRQETERFVAHVVREDRSVLEFLDADYTFLDERLARHYGIAGVSGPPWRKVVVAGTKRGGLTAQASILALTSPVGETSIVHRGKWILENLFGTPPPAPPTGLLEAFAESRSKFGPGSARQILEQHRANPSCAHCHAPIDALGATLENFDGAGAWRTRVGPFPVEPIGVMPTGETIDGPNQLKSYLLGKKDTFIRCLAGKLLSYALSRKLEDRDAATLDRVAERAALQQYRFSSVLTEVVQSSAFQRND